MSNNEVMVVDRQQANLALSIKDLMKRQTAIRKIVDLVMEKGVHYVEPYAGAKKNMLSKAGSEVLATTFMIRSKYIVQDLSKDDLVKYNVKCVGISQISGAEVDEGEASCSSNEEKYKWRKAVCQQEYDETEPFRRRIKYAWTTCWNSQDIKAWNDAPDDMKETFEYFSKKDKVTKQGKKLLVKICQVRTEPADLDNTILKMACKRAKTAMVLSLTGCSDIFTQDIKELPEEQKEEFRRQEMGATQSMKPDTVEPQEKETRSKPKPNQKRKPSQPKPEEQKQGISQDKWDRLFKVADKNGYTHGDLINYVGSEFGITDLEEMNLEHYAKVFNYASIKKDNLF
ncbi:hypothetical protein J7L67_02020 [bacterium]|nr:hypothetical protein [bacterium]